MIINSTKHVKFHFRIPNDCLANGEQFGGFFAAHCIYLTHISDL